MTNKEKKTKAKEVPKALNVEMKFMREEIMASPSAFGVPDYVLVGAMAQMNEKEYTRNQVVEAIKNFKGRKVEQK